MATGTNNSDTNRLPEGGDVQPGSDLGADQTSTLRTHRASTAKLARETVDLPPEQAAVVDLLEKLQAATGGRNPEMVRNILDFTAETYTLAAPILDGDREKEANDAPTQGEIVKVANIFLKTLREKLPPDQRSKLEKAEAGLTDLAAKLEMDTANDNALPPTRSRVPLRKLLPLLGALSLAACDDKSAPPRPPAPITAPSSGSATRDDLDEPEPRAIPRDPTTAEQVSDWFKEKWEKVGGGESSGGGSSETGSGRPFKVPTIPAVLAILWAIALATDKFKWDDRILLGGSAIALGADLLGDFLLNFKSIGINLNVLQPILGPYWWWIIENVWVITSLKYLSNGPLKGKKSLHYILGAAIWVALGYLNR